jgi:hypothetical protein
MMETSWFSPHANGGLAVNHRPQLSLTRRDATPYAAPGDGTVASLRITDPLGALGMNSTGGGTYILFTPPALDGKNLVVRFNADGSVPHDADGTVPLWTSFLGGPSDVGGRRVHRHLGAVPRGLQDHEGRRHSRLVHDGPDPDPDRHVDQIAAARPGDLP